MTPAAHPASTHPFPITTTNNAKFVFTRFLGEKNEFLLCRAASAQQTQLQTGFGQQQTGFNQRQTK